jgi:hypothetical protein
MQPILLNLINLTLKSRRKLLMASLCRAMSNFLLEDLQEIIKPKNGDSYILWAT